MRGLQMIGWKLDHIGMSPSAESYLVLHRFGPVRTSSFAIPLTSFHLPFCKAIDLQLCVHAGLIFEVTVNRPQNHV